MTKKELEKKVLELEKKIVTLESLPICIGHYCYCYHYANPTPYSPTVYPTGPIWISNPTTTPVQHYGNDWEIHSRATDSLS